MEKDRIKNQGFLSLVPLILFFVIYLGTSCLCAVKGMENPFGVMPTSTAALIALFIGFFIVRGKASDKFQWVRGGIGRPGISTPVLIAIILGAFSSILNASGGVESIVGICMKYVPAEIITAAFFVTASFISFASCSSSLAIVSVTPVALMVAPETGISIGITVAAIMGAAVFGNTLNPISDCTVVSNTAVGLRDKAGKDKMIAQAKMYVLPYVLTVVLLLVFGRPQNAVALDTAAYEISLISILPYILTLALALIGFNFVISLGSGILCGIVVGIALGKFTLIESFKLISSGFASNSNMVCMFIFVAGIIGIVEATGGLEWIVEKLTAMIQGEKSAQLVIFLLSVLLTCCIGNNSIPNVTISDITRDMMKKYRIDARRAATLLVTGAGLTVAIIPHSGIALIMSGLIDSSGVGFSFIQSAPFNFFVLLSFVMVIATMFIPFSEKGYRKDPWNYEYECLESQIGTESKTAH